MRIVVGIYVFVVLMRWIAGLGCPTLWIPAYAGMTVRCAGNDVME